jgi:hypothetical protein
LQAEVGEYRNCMKPQPLAAIMKNFVLIAFLLLTVSSPGKTQTIFSNDLLLWLYTGIENPVSIAVPTMSSNITLRCDDGIVKRLSDRKFSVKICSSITMTVLKVYNKNKLIDTKEIRVKAVPNPTILFCNQDGEAMFKGCPGIRADIVDFYKEGIVCKVEKFTITIKKNTGATVKIDNVGAFYQTAAVNAFNALNIGETVILSDFEVSVGCETEPRKLVTIFTSVYSGKKREFRY